MDYYDAPQGFRTKMHRFEDGEYRIVEEYDALLTNIYGDYMTPPPERAREPHYLALYSIED